MHQLIHLSMSIGSDASVDSFVHVHWFRCMGSDPSVGSLAHGYTDNGWERRPHLFICSVPLVQAPRLIHLSSSISSEIQIQIHIHIQIQIRIQIHIHIHSQIDGAIG
jgi:hypothetical protein